jgi:hypothetical protein
MRKIEAKAKPMLS